MAFRAVVVHQKDVPHRRPILPAQGGGGLIIEDPGRYERAGENLQVLFLDKLSAD
jgi:hypothetical protein